MKMLRVGTELSHVDRHIEERTDRHDEVNSRFSRFLRTRPTSDNSVSLIEICAVYLVLTETDFSEISNIRNRLVQLQLFETITSKLLRSYDMCIYFCALHATLLRPLMPPVLQETSC